MAVLLRRAGRVGTSLVVVAVVTFALVVAQVHLGFDTRLALHVPNALAIFAAQGAMLVLPRRHATHGAG